MDSPSGGRRPSRERDRNFTGRNGSRRRGWKGRGRGGGERGGRAGGGVGQRDQWEDPLATQPYREI